MCRSKKSCHPRRCVPSEEQKSRAAVRRRMNRHAHTEAVKILEQRGDTELSSSVASMTPSDSFDHLFAINDNAVSAFRNTGLAAMNVKKAYKALGEHEGVMSSDEFLNKEYDEKMMHLHRALALIDGDHEDAEELLYGYEVYWDEILHEMNKHSYEEGQKNQFEKRIVRKWKNLPVKTFSHKDLLDISEGDFPLDLVGGEQGIASQKYIRLGENTYYIRYDTMLGYSSEKIAYKTKDDDYLHSFTAVINDEEGDFEFSYVDDLGLNYLETETAINLFENETPSRLIRSDVKGYLASVAKVSGGAANINNTLLRDEIWTAHNYLNNNTIYHRQGGYSPERKSMVDVKMFSGGMQVDSTDLKNTEGLMKAFGNETEFDEKEESLRFIGGEGAKSNMYLREYTGSGYINAAAESKGISEGLYSANVESIDQSIKEFEKANSSSSPRFLRRTAQPPFGFGSLEEFSDTIPVGSTLSTTRLTSTTAAVTNGFKANMKDNVIFHYHTRQGASIVTVGVPHEREVLLGVNSKFVVSGKKMDNDELHIYLTDEN